MDQGLIFTNKPVTANFITPEGNEVKRVIEIRTNPITLRTSRVTLSRIDEKEKGTETLPSPPPDANRKAMYMAITQNHLPSAGGSLLHPHLQVHADRFASNHHRFLSLRAIEYLSGAGSRLFTDYAEHEKQDGQRYIGKTGSWHWMAAFAPEGFYEIWGILPGYTSLASLHLEDWENLASGVMRAQKFYRSLCRNGYNLGLLSIENGNDCLEMRAVILARSNFAPWVRNDHTGYEVMLGDMATFVQPEQTARLAREFWD